MKVGTLSRMSGVSYAAVKNLIGGRTRDPRLSTLHKIANAFSMTPAEFLDFQEMNDFSFDDATIDEDD